MRFRVPFFAARFLFQAGHGLFFASLLIVVSRESSPALGMSALMVAGLLPALVLGIVAGVLADRLGATRAYSLGATVVALPPLVAALLPGTLAVACIVAFTASVAAQFYQPAELALVRRLQTERTPAGPHSLLILSHYGGQVLGVAALAPALFFLSGTGAMLWGAALVHVAMTAAALLAARRAPALADGAIRTAAVTGVLACLRRLRRVSLARYALAALVVQAVVSRGVFIALPSFADNDIGLGKPAVAYLLVPGVLGAITGLVWAWRNVSPGGAAATMRLSMIAMGLGAFALASLDFGMEAAVSFPLPGELARFRTWLNPTLIAGLPVAFLLGAAFAGALISGRVALTSVARADEQGRAFAAQSVLTEAALVLPVLLAGTATELLGARVTFAALGVVAVVALLIMRGGAAAERPAVVAPSFEAAG